MRTLLGIFTACLLVLLTAPTASARSSAHSDYVGDMWEALEPPVPAAAVSNGDITSVRLVHQRKIIQVFMTVRTMGTSAPAGVDSDAYSFAIINGKAKVVTLTQRQNGAIYVTTTRGNGATPYRCAWLHHSINTATRTVAMTIPRSCMSNPRYVRLQASSTSYDADDRAYEDDAYSRYDTARGPTHPGSSPWVKRG